MWQCVLLSVNVQRIKEYFNLDLLVGSYQTGLVCGVNLETFISNVVMRIRSVRFLCMCSTMDCSGEYQISISRPLKLLCIIA